MAGRQDFTDEEWEQLRKGVTGAAVLVSVSDPGFFETFKEAGAAARHLKAARGDSTSELVRELAEAPASGFGLGMTPEQVEGETLGALRAGASALQAKAPDEAPAYGQFVEDVARSVAAAAEDVGAAETRAIEKIRSALASAQPQAG
ncbi:MAG TPA: hypothetical protein VG079_05305 [Gaiellaceae bacterium]|nr:hypothetical protein [Gaiellaceae bacterium]